ncbi:MAG: hypothetical protein GY829_11155 [Gammaproteobacteria bacterium]|nr:hypothetical protein [Gammaproteobacteria bacterium]
MNLNIEDMVINYQLSNISSDNNFISKIVINAVKVQQEVNQNVTSSKILTLPEINTDNISILKKLKNLSIRRLDIYHNNNMINIIDADIINLSTNVFSVAFTTDDLLDEMPNSVRFISTVKFNQNEITVFIEQGKSHLLQSVYIIDDKQIKLTADINLENINALLVNNFISTTFEPKGKLSFELVQDTRSSDIDISLHIQGQTKNEIEYLLADDSMFTSAIEFDINSKINLLNTTQQVLINDIQFDLFASKLNLTDREKLYSVTAENYIITGVVDNFQSSLNNIQGSPLKISGQFSTPKLQISQQKLAIDVDTKAKGTFELLKEHTITSEGELTLSEMTVSHPSSLLNSHLSVKWEGINASLTQGIVSLQLDSDSGHVFDVNYDKLTLKNDINLLGEKLTGEGQLLVNEEILTPYSFDYSKETNELSMKLNKTQLTSHLLNDYLDVIGKEKNISLNIEKGEVSHIGEFSISDKFQADSELEIKDMLFQFGENIVEGLNLYQKLISTDPLFMHALFDIDRISFSSGLEINNIKGILETRADNTIDINDVVGELWDGKLSVEKIKLQDSNFEQTSVLFSDISLTELVFFIDIPGLYGDGKIELNLPLTLNNGVISVHEGTFKTTEGGVIKYSSGQTELKNDENIALKALENFHYKELNGTLSYNKDGLYHIKLHLLGENPDLYDGYPIDFILNLNGELSGVFRSLFLTGNFDEAVMEQVRTTQSEQ